MGAQPLAHFFDRKSAGLAAVEAEPFVEPSWAARLLRWWSALERCLFLQREGNLHKVKMLGNDVYISRTASPRRFRIWVFKPTTFPLAKVMSNFLPTRAQPRKGNPRREEV